MTHVQEDVLALAGYFFFPTMLLVALIIWLVWVLPEIRFPFAFVFATALAVALWWNLIFPPIKSEHPLYLVLTEILNEPVRLRTLPPSGPTGYDVSSLVCPLVTQQSLTEMYESARTATTGPRVSYEHSNSGAWGPPNERDSWRLVRRHMFYSEVLWIQLAEPDYCYARFQRGL